MPHEASSSLEDLFARALQSHQAGRLDDAARLYRQSLQWDPCHADARHLLGVIAYQAGETAAAVALIGNAIRLQGQVATYHSNLGSALKACGRPGEAVTAYQTALCLKPDYDEAYYNLGTARHGLGQLAGAVAALGAALRINPGFAEAHYNLGVAVQDGGRTEDAIAAYTTALAIRPGYPQAQCNRGVLLAGRERLDDALRDYVKAIRLRPGFAAAHANLGKTLQDLGRCDDAIGACAAALCLQPDHAEAHTNRGTALKAVGRLTEAVAAYGRARRIRPDLVEAAQNLAIALKDLGRRDDAIAAYHAALQLKPDLAESRLGLVNAAIPMIVGSIGESDSTAENFIRACESLAAWNDAHPGKLGKAAGSTMPFNLAYRPGDLLSPLSRYGDLICAAAAAFWQTGGPASAQAPQPRLRLLIVTGYARRHSVWDVILRGIIAHLDRRRIEVRLYHTRPVTDAETDWARRHVDHFVQGPKPIGDWLEEVARDRPDAIFYPEIGMDPASCTLATLRLAPLQIAGWGHPVTTGLPSIDLFLSGDLLEGPGADRHYRERLVRLPGTGVCTQPRPVEAQRWGGPDRRTGVVRFALCQQPIKFDPAYDALLARIARDVGPSEFWLASLEKMPWATAKLRDRLAAAFQADGLDPDAHLHIMPWLPPSQFADFLDQMDIYLDCPAFSGYTTAWQAIHRGLPIVTLDGEFLRQRLAAGLLRQIGMTEGIAASGEQYRKIAVGWAAESRDADRWRTRRAAIRGAAPKADGNQEAVMALQETLFVEVAKLASAAEP